MNQGFKAVILTQASRVIGGALSALALGSAHAADLRIEIEGVVGSEGKVLVSVFDHAGQFPIAGQALAAAIVPPQAPAVVFPGLAPGEYAVAAFHDRNGNGKLDTNIVGLPAEPYGFSNNAAGVMGPPKFDAARVELRQDTRIVIRLR